MKSKKIENISPKELDRLLAECKRCLYEAIIFNQINVIGTEWYYRISRPSGNAISIKM